MANGKPISSHLLSVLKKQIADTELKKCSWKVHITRRKQENDDQLKLRKRLSDAVRPTYVFNLRK